MKNFILNAVIFSIIINIFFSLGLGFIASSKEISPPDGIVNLSFKEQVVHMAVHHRQVLIVSSIIVAFIVAVSVGLAMKITLIK